MHKRACNPDSNIAKNLDASPKGKMVDASNGESLYLCQNNKY